ncbi:MAG: aspartate kinase [Promethearchaeota archaeon]
MPIIVMKFGGSCLTDKNAFEKIFRISNLYNNTKKVYVISALNGITDLLLKTALDLDNIRKTDQNIALIEKKHIDIIEQIFEEDTEQYFKAKDWIDEKLTELDDAFADIKEFGLEPYYRDYVLSFGEILSTFILNQYLISRNLDSVYVPANKIIITDDEFNNAYPLYTLTNYRTKEFLLPFLENPKKDIVVCLTGFIGRNKMGYITTLGRGGSDYTATILAHSLYSVGNDKNIKVILWKDVDGLLAINPKYVPASSLIKNLDYNEAKHIANFGAKVLHPKCLEAIQEYRIPLEIRNFDKPSDENFTEISDRTDKELIKGISAVELATIITVISGSLVDVPGVLTKIFKVMSKNKISVSLVAQSSSEISTSFIVKAEDSEKAVRALEVSKFFSEFFTIKWEEVAVINITGIKILETKTKAEIFNALDKKNVRVKAISQGYNELNLSIVIEKDKLIEAVNIIHDDLFEEFES